MYHHRAFMAITTAIIISVVMMVVGLSIAFVSLFSRTNGLSAHLKEKSYFAAQSCLEQALLNLSLDNTYQANQTIPIQASGESLSCTLSPITVEGSNKVIKAHAVVGDSTTNLVLKVNSATLVRVSLTEVATL